MSMHNFIVEKTYLNIFHSYFAKAVQASILPPEIAEWNYSAPLEELYKSIGAETDRMRKELVQLVVSNAKDELDANLR